MQLTKQSEYALQGLVCLASQPRRVPVPLAEIAAAQHLPNSFLAKIFQKLVRHDLLTAERGPGSGYQLVRDSASVSIREILETVEGPQAFESCIFWRGHCGDDAPCLLHFYFARCAALLTQPGSTRRLDAGPAPANTTPDGLDQRDDPRAGQVAGCFPRRGHRCAGHARRRQSRPPCATGGIARIYRDHLKRYEDAVR